MEGLGARLQNVRTYSDRPARGLAAGVRHGRHAGSLGVRLYVLRTNGQSARHTPATQTSRLPFGSM